MTNFLFAIVVALLLSGCGAALQDADFYECEPNNTLVVCEPGTGPPAGQDCKSVGSGQTTIKPKAC